MQQASLKKKDRVYRSINFHADGGRQSSLYITVASTVRTQDKLRESRVLD